MTKNIRKALTYLAIAVLAGLNALNYVLFIFPNGFAPSGLNGLCTMVQYLTGISVGYLSLLLNIPLAIAVFRKVSRTLAIRAMVYVVAFSAGMVLLQSLDLSDFVYSTENGTSTIMGPLVGGILSGGCCSVLLSAGCYTGGTDFIASLIHRKKPELNFFWIGFGLNILVAGLSFFVYGMKIEPVLLCILYSFAYSLVQDKMNKSWSGAARFEIITESPDEVCRAIVEQLHHAATVFPAKGVYRGKPTNVIICVVNRSQSSLLASVLRGFPGTFAVVSPVSQVVGNFKRIDRRGKQAQSLFDPGEGTGIS